MFICQPINSFYSTNYLGDRGSIPGRVIPKTQKWYLMPPCLTLCIIMYGSRIKWSNPRNGVVPFPTPWCSSYWKRILWVTLDYGHQLTYILEINDSWDRNCENFLNLCPHCHLFQGDTNLNKNTKIEIFHQKIFKLQDKKVITIKLEFHDLKSKAIENRFNKKQATLFTQQLGNADEELCNHPNKKADKTNIFVALNKTDYDSNLQNIRDDHNKCKKISKNLTDQIKSKN